MLAVLRIQLIGLIKGFLYNLICACISLGIIYIFNVGKIPDVLYEGLITFIKICALVCSAIMGVVYIYVVCRYGSGKPNKYWKKRMKSVMRGVKFRLIILTILPHIVFCILGFLLLNNWGNTLIELSSVINKDKPTLVFVHILNWVASMAIFQLAYSIASFIKFKKAECKNCKNIYCFEWEYLNTDKKESTENEKVAKKKVRYSCDEFFGTIDKRHYYDIVDKQITTTVEYENYKCICYYCGNKTNKRIYKGTTRT